MTKPDELYQQIEDGRPTPEQAALLMSMAQGDTSAFMLDSGVPDTAPTPTPAAPVSEATQQPQEPELTADNAVILAKDGVHTIPFDRLSEARQTAAEARQEAERLKAESEAKDARIAELEAQAAKRAEQGVAPTAQDQQLAQVQAAISQGASPDLFGDWSEEAMSAGLDKLTDMKIERVEQKVMAMVAERLAPLQQQRQVEASEQHFKAIYQAHPDADSIVESKEFSAWVATRPAYERASIAKVLDDGSAADVVELFSAFKGATGQAQPSASAAKAAAQAALDKAKAAPPASLSDIPGGKPVGGNLFEELAIMDGASMSDRLRGLSNEQIEAFLNKQM
ncbi:MAG: hypothetical protein ACRC9H_17740 [Aeromonas veronii]